MGLCVCLPPPWLAAVSCIGIRSITPLSPMPLQARALNPQPGEEFRPQPGHATREKLPRLTCRLGVSYQRQKATSHCNDGVRPASAQPTMPWSLEHHAAYQGPQKRQRGAPPPPSPLFVGLACR